VSAQRWFFHASPPRSRSKIAEEELLPGTEASYGPPAVYLFRHRLFAENYIGEAMDVWKVDALGLRVYPDPEDPLEAAYTERAVPAARLAFLGTYLDGEEVVA
jgi:hypothetical protein